jgi:hypothetical protein
MITISHETQYRYEVVPGRLWYGINRSLVVNSCIPFQNTKKLTNYVHNLQTNPMLTTCRENIAN